jgi:glycine dehydrogenase subunit 1
MRYLPHTEDEIAAMLKAVGVKSIDDLFGGIPEGDLLRGALDLPEPMPEPKLRRHMRLLADKNIHVEEAKSFIGGGAYHHYVPSAITPIIKRGEFLTAYTPYQPEVSQGTLQAIFEFQTMMCELTGMDVANASNYDLSTSCAEALLMAERVNKRPKALVARSLHPHYRQVIHTYLKNQDYEVVEIPFDKSGQLDAQFLRKNLDASVGAVLVQSPNFLGVVEELHPVSAAAREAGAFFIVANPEPVSYAVLPSPGEVGADVAIAEGMSFGAGLNFGGPYLGIFATKESYIRQMPGRLIGETRDRDGRRGYVLTFATREQHIRREKATSNICTNQGLMALAASVYLSLMGPEGLQKLALINMSRRQHFEHLVKKRFPKALAFDGPRFNETVVKLSVPVMGAVVEILKDGFFPGIDLSSYYPELEGHLLVCTTEMNSTLDIETLVEKLGKYF